MIPFNKPFFSGKEIEYIKHAVSLGKISGNGFYTKACQDLFARKFKLRKTLLTTSCTDALEMSAILVNIQMGDEVIVPSFTFVSSANAFVLRGARIVFADSQPSHPNLDPAEIEKLLSPRTKAIVVVHYAGVACPMDEIMDVALKHHLLVVEDAAHAIDSYYNGRSLGSIGHLSAFSFHETKNIISGEGGLLAINEEQLIPRSDIIWEKGTNRAAFFRGEIDKYNWVDVGSSFLPSEITAAFLYAQLEKLEIIQKKRMQLWEKYEERLKPLALRERIVLPSIPRYATNNGHMFYLICESAVIRNALIAHLRKREITATFHYLPLHRSPFYRSLHGERSLPNSEYFSDRLIRLPLYFELSDEDQIDVVEAIYDFFKSN